VRGLAANGTHRIGSGRRLVPITDAVRSARDSAIAPLDSEFRPYIA
jgi:hypothetical protein